MKNYILKNSMLSLATIVVLGTAGCGGSNSSSSTEDDTVTEVTKELPKTTEVLSGNVNLADSTTNKSSAKKSIARADTLQKLDCGTSAMVQLYAIDDTQYEQPLLKEAIEVNQTNCAFSITDTDFVDANSSSSNNQYLVRTIIEDGNTTVELSAAKLSEGVEVGVVDPVATLIKERFSVVIAEVKASMQKLESLGVTSSSIETAIDNIITDFEKNLDSTVANLKEDIASGKVVIDMTMFQTTETLDSVDSTATEAQLAQRQEKADAIVQKFDSSSASTTFTMLESSMKQEQLDNVTITQDMLRKTLSPALAEIKYGVVESFVKIGLNVHDGYGNLIVYMPIEESRKGELPGKMYQLSYTTKENGEDKIGYMGDDFHIRVINPETDLNQLNGNEDWYRAIKDNNVVIPSAVINAMIVAKDNITTMQDLGKAINKASTGLETDVFATTGIYDTVMNDNVETSVENIVNVFKDDFLKQSFAQLLWDETDTIFSSNGNINEDDLVANILDMPFIVENDENATLFLERLGKNATSMDFIVNSVESSLSNGIPVSDSNSSMLQFKTGTTITPSSAMKPLASLAMIDLFMEAKGSEEELEFIKQPLNDMFGWMLKDGDTRFDNKSIWTLNESMVDSDQDTDSDMKQSSVRKSQSFADDEQDTIDEIQENTDFVMSLIKVITGNDSIQIERKFAEMNEAFAKTIHKIDMKSSDDFNFEEHFKGDIIDFNGAVTQEASVSFELADFNGSITTLDENDTLILAPIFVNKESYEWKTFTDHNVTLVFNQETKRYEAESLLVYNPELKFDNTLNEDETGKFVANNDFDLIVVKADGTKISIANFPLYAGENNLDTPVYYSSYMSYITMPEFSIMDDGEDYDNDSENMQMGDTSEFHNDNMFVEHQYLESSADVFFPQITKIQSGNVGENLFSYDIDTKTFTKNLSAGVVNDANMTITLLSKGYSDNSSTPTIIETIDLENGNIQDGAFLQLELKGSQIKTQTINMDILYVGEDGQVEYELYKENDNVKEYDDKDNYLKEYSNNKFQEDEITDSEKEDMKDKYSEWDLKNDRPFVGILPTEAGILAGATVKIEIDKDGILAGFIANEQNIPIIIISGKSENGITKSHAINGADSSILSNCTGVVDAKTGSITMNVVPTDGSEPFSYTLEQEDDDGEEYITESENENNMSDDYMESDENTNSHKTKDNQKDVNNSISVEDGFNEKWLDGRTLWSGGFDEDSGEVYKLTLTFKDGKNQAQMGIVDTITTPLFNNDYTIIDGVIIVDEIGGEKTADSENRYQKYQILNIDDDKIIVCNDDAPKLECSSTSDNYQLFFTTKESVEKYLEILNNNQD